MTSERRKMLIDNLRRGRETSLQKRQKNKILKDIDKKELNEQKEAKDQEKILNHYNKKNKQKTEIENLKNELILERNKNKKTVDNEKVIPSKPIINKVETVKIQPIKSHRVVYSTLTGEKTIVEI